VRPVLATLPGVMVVGCDGSGADARITSTDRMERTSTPLATSRPILAKKRVRIRRLLARPTRLDSSSPSLYHRDCKATRGG